MDLDQKHKQDRIILIKDSKDSKNQLKTIQKKLEGMKDNNQLLETLVDELNNKCME